MKLEIEFDQIDLITIFLIMSKLKSIKLEYKNYNNIIYYY